MAEVIDINKDKAEKENAAAKEATVTLTYADMMDQVFVETLGKMLNMPTQVKLGARLRHWLGRYSTEIQKHMESFDKDRKELLEKYSEKDEEGKCIMLPLLDDKDNPILGNDRKPLQKYDVSEENLVELNKEVSDLMNNSKCSFPFYKIKVDLGTFPEVLLSHEMVAMEKIIEWQ